MTIEEIQARKAEILVELDSADITEERISELETETETLDAEERTIIEKAEERKAEEQAVIEAVNNNEGEEIVLPETNERKENTTMTLEEIRSSNDYALAYLKGVIKGNDDEARALLTVNSQETGAYVPVPTLLENEIKTAWSENKLVGLCKKSFFRGDLKVGLELSAGGASIHLEGATRPNEEAVTLGVVTIQNKMLKKWISVSDEALEGTTVDTMGYIFKEIAYQIVKKAEEELIGAIKACGTAASSTGVGVPIYSAATIGVDTIVYACSLLSDEARDLTLVMNKQTYPAFVAAAHAASYGFDVFNGLADKIVFSDKLPARSAATTTNNVYAIVGDFGRGAQVNLPNGEGVTLKVDDASLAEYDLVKVVGRMYAGIGVVADKAFVKISI